ncbi:hypothetical protein BJ322DRAFT_1108516 [Thelephora terrestris]|uniref:Peptidase S33 tripeptidyl aminopeptidase-like C-terminal domain-containing protein n=1 Tax=Thelephora terrestris TaxID=56493 RepID=A0A9P6HFT3_9AGAM|nr:hypothetical protein BJ322DRAFT_1108516 [Thelephora terrestris]
MFCPLGPATLLTLGLLAKHVVAARAPTPRNDPSVLWSSCESFGVNSTDSNLQCGSLDVPMDYHDNSAGTARLAVIKYSATAPNKLGGPGESGVEAISESGQAFSRAFQGAFDIVSWDPRGVGYTFPGAVTCFNSSEEDANFWYHTVVSYINETISGRFDQQDLEELYSQVDSTKEKFKAFTAGCQNGPVGPYLKYIGTSSTVRDLVSLGDAIVGKGEPIDYWGISYGTVLGFNFVNMFPERVGHVILDGVVDPTSWVSFELAYSAFTNTEKTYSGLTDGCAKAGRVGCKLIELTGDNASGDDVKALLDFAHDAALELYRAGVEVPAEPGYFKYSLYHILYTPMMWSDYVNGPIYQFVALALQAAQAHNITTDGGFKYNVPSGNITIDQTGNPPSPNLTSYTTAAIVGADDFNDDKTTITNLFDIIVNVTRQDTATFGTVWDDGSFGWPVRSVERLAPFSPKQLKNPVLIIGNAADPITPFANAEKAANLLGDNAFLLEQLGFGHTSIAQFSSCTLGVMINFFANSTLPKGRTAQCPVDNTDLFPVLNGSSTTSKRSTLLRRWR